MEEAEWKHISRQISTHNVSMVMSAPKNKQCAATGRAQVEDRQDRGDRIDTPAET